MSGQSLFLHSLALMDYAGERGLNEAYRDVSILLEDTEIDPAKAPAELQSILKKIPAESREEVLRSFLEMAYRRMNRVPAEIISAVPLTDEQLYGLEVKLIRLTRKQLDITTTVDPSLLGGVRILVENTVIDESLKRRIADMKQTVYKGVYLR